MPQEPSLLTLWSDSPLLSSLAWALIAILLLYLARRPAHELIDAASRTLYRGLRLASQLVLNHARRIGQRNREVLLAIAEDQVERTVEHEYRRVEALIQRDLSGYPALHRALSDQVGRIDEDYRQSADVPPSPPAWLQAVGAVAAVEAKGDPAVAKILEDIHGTLQTSCHNALLEYRAASRRRHLGLKRMVPYWRRMSNILDKVHRTLERIETRGAAIDQQMARFEEIRAQQAKTLRNLNSSAIVRFLTAATVLAVAALGAWFNFQLIIGPMETLVDTGPLAGGLPGTGAAAGFLLLLQITLGVLLADLLGVTRLFGFLGGLDELLRRRLTIAAGAALVGLALAQASLAWLSAAQPAAEALGLSEHWIPRLGHTLMGFLLPLTLAATAVPLEAFLQFGRIVFGRLLAAAARVLAALLRWLALAAKLLGPLLKRAYDLLVFVPLWVEEAARGRRAEPAAATDKKPSPAPADAVEAEQPR